MRTSLNFVRIKKKGKKYEFNILCENKEESHRKNYKMIKFGRFGKTITNFI